jgi:hypothetical protein
MERDNRNILELKLLISKIGDEIYIAIDGNKIELSEFGINDYQLNIMANKIENIIRNIMREKNGKRNKSY